MNFSEVIVQLIGSPRFHARLINTFSMLEYVGARKILKSQNAETMSMQILSHAAEEIRHAQILKGLALQLSEGELDSYREEHLLCGVQARAYFQSLDQACASILPTPDARKNYVLTTLLIEERAMRIYPEYEALLQTHQIPNALKAIIRDEDKHLAEMQEELIEGVTDQDLALLRAFEAARFQDFMEAVVDTLRLARAEAPMTSSYL